MAQPKTVGYGTSRKSHGDPAGSEHHRHDEDGGEAHAWQYDTGPMARLVAVWKRAVRRAEDTLVASAGAFAAVDVVAALSGCYAPLLTPLLNVARAAGLVVLVPAVLRTLAIAHAEREDSELVRAIAIAIGVAALYVAVRTWLVVQMCSF
jgi:hypothetical protein